MNRYRFLTILALQSLIAPLAVHAQCASQSKEELEHQVELDNKALSSLMTSLKSLMDGEAGAKDRNDVMQVGLSELKLAHATENLISRRKTINNVMEEDDPSIKQTCKPLFLKISAATDIYQGTVDGLLNVTTIRESAERVRTMLLLMNRISSYLLIGAPKRPVPGKK